MTGSDEALGLAGAAGFVLAVGAFVVAAGLALAALRFVGGIPPEQGVEGAVGSFALGAVVAAPGVLAMLAVRGRPALLLPAAIVLIPLSFLSVALVTLPLLIPAVMLMIGYGRRSSGRPEPRGKTSGTLLAVFVLLAAAVVILFIHQDPRSYTTSTGGGSTSDVITFFESLPSLALTACAVASGWVLAAPRRMSHQPERTRLTQTRAPREALKSRPSPTARAFDLLSAGADRAVPHNAWRVD